MPEQGDRPEGTGHESTLAGAQDDEKLLDDLDAEEEEAAGVEGGQRTTSARWHGRA